MFVGVAKSLKRAGGLKIGAGVRITKKNAMWMIWAFFFIAMGWLMWKMLILSCWGMYYMFYGLYLCYKYLFLGIAWVCKKAYGLIKDFIQKRREDAAHGEQ